MPKEWSSFRITLLLYILVLILPLSFYFVYSSFKTIQSDTKVVHQISGIGGGIEYLALNPENQNYKQTITQIDRTLQEISVWAMQNDRSDLYIGAESLSKDFTEVETYWKNYKQILSQQDTIAIKDYSLQCWEKTNTLATVVQKMVYLKQNKMINLFYFALTVAMILTLLIIYMVRTYIHIQMKKHAIHDHETGLFNQKYFLSDLRSACARAVRHEYPLAILHIEIEGFEKGNTSYDKKTRLHTLQAFGELLHLLVRAGDVPSRYSENHFLISLPFTQKENALLFEKRIRQALMKEDCQISEKIELNFSTAEFNKEETEEAFVERSLAS